MLRHVSNIIMALATLAACQVAGVLGGRALGLPIPGAVLGMALLTVALLLRRRPPAPQAALTRTAGVLLRWMGLLFVPAGVGVMANAGPILAELLPIVVAIVGSSLAGLIVTGVVMQCMIGRRMIGRRDTQPLSLPLKAQGMLHAD